MASATIRCVSWNIRCGIFDQNASLTALGAGSDMQYIARCLIAVDPDVVCLQEVLFVDGEEPSQVARLAAAIGLRHFAEWRLGPTHLLDGAGMGLAVLTRGEILASDRILLPNPQLEARGRTGETFRSHDKGLLKARIRWGEDIVTVVCAHFVPFHIFGVSPTDRQLAVLRRAIDGAFSQLDDNAAIVCGDLNVEDVSELVPPSSRGTRLKRLVRAPTREDGRQTDHILGSSTCFGTASWSLPTRSDHRMCVADILIEPSSPALGQASTAVDVASSPTAILHLSDLHFGPGSAQDVDWKSFIDLAHREERRDMLVRSLQRLPRMPDLVVVSGDLTIACRPEGFSEFETIIRQLIRDGHLPPAERIIIVPGNHDVERPREVLRPRGTERWARFCSAIGGRFAHPWIADAPNALTPDRLRAAAKETMQAGARIWGGVWRPSGSRDLPDDVFSLPFIFDREKRVLAYAFNSASISQATLSLTSQIREDMEWLRGLKDQNSVNEKVTRVLEAFASELRIDGARIDPRELNLSADLCADLAQADEAFSGSLKLAVLHHHVAPIFPEEVKKFETLLNAGRFKRHLVEAGFHVVLHGHKHWPEAFLDPTVSQEAPLIVVSGGTVGGAAPERSNGPGY